MKRAIAFLAALSALALLFAWIIAQVGAASPQATPTATLNAALLSKTGIIAATATPTYTATPYMPDYTATMQHATEQAVLEQAGKIQAMQTAQGYAMTATRVREVENLQGTATVRAMEYQATDRAYEIQLRTATAESGKAQAAAAMQSTRAAFEWQADGQRIERNVRVMMWAAGILFASAALAWAIVAGLYIWKRGKM